jgi:hypothetical protein
MLVGFLHKINIVRGLLKACVGRILTNTFGNKAEVLKIDKASQMYFYTMGYVYVLTQKQIGPLHELSPHQRGS